MTDQMVLVVGLAGIVIFCLLSFIRYASLIGSVNETKRKYNIMLERSESTRNECQRRIAQGQPDLNLLLGQVMDLRRVRDNVYVRLLELEDLREKDEDCTRQTLTKVER